MQRTAWILGSWCVCVVCSIATAEDDAPHGRNDWRTLLKAAPARKVKASNERKTAYRLEPARAELVARTYPVADLVVPLPTAQIPVVKLAEPPKAVAPRFQYLVEHLRRFTGADAWRGQTAIRFYETTLSFVILQTPEVHERIADELGRLRRELDVQVSLEFVVVSGSRGELANLVADYAGELGRFEKEELLKKVNDSDTLHPILSPKMTMFNRTTASVESKGHLVAASPTIAKDRRSVRLKLSHAQDGKLMDLVSHCQTVDLRVGRAAAVHFEAPRMTSGLEPADDAEELLVIVTPTIIVAEEEEELLGIPTVNTSAVVPEHETDVVFTVKPRIIVQEEEEDLLGIPTGSPEDDE